MREIVELFESVDEAERRLELGDAAIGQHIHQVNTRTILLHNTCKINSQTINHIYKRCRTSIHFGHIY